MSKILGGLLLFWGGIVSIGLLLGITLSHATGVGLAILSMLLVFFGLSPLLLGGWLLYSGIQAEKRALREQFFQLLRMNQGRLSLLDYVTATRIEPAIARRHLDGWAQEFFAEFEVNERGDIYYVFPIETMPLPESTHFQLLGRAIRQWLQSAV
ncbi:hypothetical protein [Leptothermofonsia sp. ETS-13]|uniref:hypothetical protein n=1 Tax=Leptothermofonsia sp. ETS-13 TaxID=3035696 RepID=UPI003B9FD07E